LRRSKEALVATALKLQVAIKIAQDDELTISGLQQQLEHAKGKEIIAIKQTEEALETINALKIEVNTLRRKFQEPEKVITNAATHNLAIMQQYEAINSQADQEVDGLLDSAFPTSAPRDIPSTVLQNATPFDRWKMDAFLFTPDTPAASFAHDQHVVHMLVDAANKAFHDEAQGKSLTRPTKTSIAKMKRTMSSSTPGPALTANDFDVMPSDLDLMRLSAERPGSVARPDKTFFLSPGPGQRWGDKEKFDHRDKARLNLWTSQTPLERKPSSVRLKSLRIDNTSPGHLSSPNYSPSNPNHSPNGNPNNPNNNLTSSVRFTNKVAI